MAFESAGGRHGRPSRRTYPRDLDNKALQQSFAITKHCSLSTPRPPDDKNSTVIACHLRFLRGKENVSDHRRSSTSTVAVGFHCFSRHQRTHSRPAGPGCNFHSVPFLPRSSSRLSVIRRGLNKPNGYHDRLTRFAWVCSDLKTMTLPTAASALPC